LQPKHLLNDLSRCKRDRNRSNTSAITANKDQDLYLLLFVIAFQANLPKYYVESGSKLHVSRKYPSLRTVAGWVEAVRSNENLRADLRNAEVITLWLGSHDILGAVGISGGPCYPGGGEVDLDCLRKTTDQMQVGYDQLLSEITALASPDETLILIAEIGIAPPWAVMTAVKQSCSSSVLCIGTILSFWQHK
jgi:hypothetical protein